jgi:hypothetical protein
MDFQRQWIQQHVQDASQILKKPVHHPLLFLLPHMYNYPGMLEAAYVPACCGTKDTTLFTACMLGCSTLLRGAEPAPHAAAAAAIGLNSVTSAAGNSAEGKSMPCMCPAAAAGGVWQGAERKPQRDPAAAQPVLLRHPQRDQRARRCAQLQPQGVL